MRAGQGVGVSTSGPRVHGAAADLAAAVAGALRDAGSDTLFGLPGGGNNLELAGAAQSAGMRFVLTHTENAAAIMAAVYGSLKQCPTACIVTRGPGAASAANGVAQAFLDRQPLLLITDAVSSADRERIAHQRLDQGAMFRPITKWTGVLGASGSDVVMRRALSIAAAPPPGPVHLDFDPAAPDTKVPLPAPVQSPSATVADVQRALAGKSRPVILLGLGALTATAQVRTLLRETNVPALMTYRAKGIVPDSWPNCAGLLTGATVEAPVLEAADVIVAVGVDSVELIPNPWPYTAPVVSIASWPDDSPYFAPACEYVGDVSAVLPLLRADLADGWTPGFAERQRRDGLDRLLAAPSSSHGVTPQEVITLARGCLPADTMATVDAGAHMLTAMPLWTAEEPDEVLISSGLATMGFALPAAIAASLARAGRRVVCFVGDGGIGMGLAELETLARLDLPVTVVVFNDSTLTLIALKQRAEGHGGSAAVRYADTSFAGIAASMGVAAETVSTAADYVRAVVHSARTPRPYLLDVRIDPAGYPQIIDSIRGAR
jgi:acetolactate synthase-1/2/3 large subunit